jgi:formate dehydrogenase major subunit/formate dehydrogenase alpha subunit
VAGLVTTFGAGAMTNSIREIRDAELLFVIGSNTSEAHPIIAMEMKRAIHRGAKLIVADPRSIWMTTIADRHLQLKPGTDVWLLNAMAHVIVTEGLADKAFIEQNTEGFESVRDKVVEYTPEKAEEITGVPAEDIRKSAREYATTDRAGIYYTLGITEHTHGTDNVYALSNLVLMTGHLGRSSVGMNPLRGQNNVQGANDAGATPVYYPGYQKVTDPDVHAKYEKSWGVKLSPNDGLNLNVMMKEVGKSIKGMFVMGEDIVLSEPDVSKLEAGLNNIEFMVFQDIFLNQTAQFADVILPAACFAEKEGVFTNSERRVQRVRKAVEPPGQARADWKILVDLANAAGTDWHYDNPAEVYAEMAKDAPKFAGISHERIDGSNVGLQWPCPDENHPGTMYLHEGGKIMRGKGLFQAVDYRPSKEQADSDYPLVLSTGRTLYHYNCATQTRRAPGPDEKQPEAFVEIHPKNARQRNVKDGELVELKSRRGSIRVRVIVSRQVRPGCIWMPLHFAEARANMLTVAAGDAVTGTAEYKVCAAEVVKLAEEQHGFSLASLALLLAGCFNPQIPEGRACSGVAPACPPGQTCENGVCLGAPVDATAVPDGRSMIDALPAADAPPVDAPPSACPMADDDTVALYRFDGDLLDSVGTNHGISGGESFVSGAVDCDSALTNLVFDTNRVVIPNSADWELATGSIDFWFRPVADNGRFGILSRDATGRDFPGHLTLFQYERGLAVRVQTESADAVACTGAATLTDSQWHYVVINFGPPAIELYVDGVLGMSTDTIPIVGSSIVCNTAGAFGIDGNNNPWVVGASSILSDNGLATPLNDPMAGGRIDNLRISSIRR